MMGPAAKPLAISRKAMIVIVASVRLAATSATAISAEPINVTALAVSRVREPYA